MTPKTADVQVVGNVTAPRNKEPATEIQQVQNLNMITSVGRDGEKGGIKRKEVDSKAAKLTGQRRWGNKC